MRGFVSPRLRTPIVIVGASIALLSAAVFWGWGLGISILASGIPGTVAMNPLTAGCFAMAGLALILHCSETKAARRASLALSGAMIFCGAAILLRYLTAAPILLDQFLFSDALSMSRFGPNRMAPNTAGCICLLGLGLIALNGAGRRRSYWGQFCLMSAWLVSVLVLIGYVFSIVFLVRIGENIPMAANTAMAFVLACSTALVAQSERGFMPGLLDWWRRLGPMGVAIVVGSLLSFMAFMAVWQWETLRYVGAFVNLASERALAVEEGVDANVDQLYAVRAFFNASEEVQQDEFEEFMKPLLPRMPQLYSVEWCPRVPDDQRNAFETAVRKSRPGFSIHARDESNPTAQRRPEIFPVLYTTPEEHNVGGVGTDHAELPERERAMVAARKSRDIVLTEKTYLRRVAGPAPAGMLAVVPVFNLKRGFNAADGLSGYLVGVFGVDRLVEESLKRTAPAGLDLYVFDVTNPSRPELLYFHRARIQAHPERPPSEALSYSELTDSLHYTQEAKLSSRVWQIICVPTSDYAVSQRTWVPWMVLMGGLVMTALTALLFFEQSSRANVLQTINLSLREEISGRKQAEAQMLHVQKLDAIGELAGGIAHDFNNILSGIMGYALLVRDELHQPEEARKDLDQIMKAGNRAKELIGQILVFSRRSAGELKKSSQPLGPILQDAIKLIRPTLPKTIEISFKENAKPLVSVDATRIYQVIVNLCVNAGQAMPTGGKLKILLEEAPIEESPTWMIDDPVGARTLKSGRYAMITVQDTGTGISKEVLPRIFEPYFTTKGVGQGTGMGLSVAYGIVQQHGGDIRVYSEVGKGTTFKIFLPVVDSSRAIVMPEEIGELRGGHESILVVDDEEMLVNMVAKHLGRLGYKVSSFTHGPTALEAFKKSPSAFDLVISDLSMPELTGDKFAEEAGKLRPDLPIILCSGFVDVISPQRQSELRIWKVVTKPFIGPDLQREVRRALDSAQKKSSAGALAN